MLFCFDTNEFLIDRDKYNSLLVIFHKTSRNVITIAQKRQPLEAAVKRRKESFSNFVYFLMTLVPLSFSSVSLKTPSC